MRNVSASFGRTPRLAAVIALATLAMLVPTGMAQTPVSDEQMAEAPHPIHIHGGTCAELGEVVAPLTDLAPQTGEMTGAATAHPIKTSHTVVDLPLHEIIDGGHAINVHQSADEIDLYIACGDIGGVVMEEGGREDIIIALGALNDSGHTGIAWLGADGDQTEVSVTLIEPDAMQ